MFLTCVLSLGHWLADWLAARSHKTAAATPDESCAPARHSTQQKLWCNGMSKLWPRNSCGQDTDNWQRTRNGIIISWQIDGNININAVVLGIPFQLFLGWALLTCTGMSVNGSFLADLFQLSALLLFTSKESLSSTLHLKWEYENENNYFLNSDLQQVVADEKRLCQIESSGQRAGNHPLNQGNGDGGKLLAFNSTGNKNTNWKYISYNRLSFLVKALTSISLNYYITGLYVVLSIRNQFKWDTQQSVRKDFDLIYFYFRW